MMQASGMDLALPSVGMRQTPMFTAGHASSFARHLIHTRAAKTPAHETGTVSGRKNPELYSTAATSPPNATQPFLSQPALSSTPLAALRKPEVLAPAGGWPQLRAAVENGADAVYFGVSDFNARARASNFTPAELPEVMTYLHHRGVKGYLVINVLVFDSELQTVAHRAQQAAAAGVDALIVQDVGAVELIRKAAPGLAIHGSTQMSITSAEGSAFAVDRLGIDRVVVGRELSIKDIADVSAKGGAEVEAFVHGALCVSYSGQCFSSEAWGGRSANRGQCAQACRLDYGMVVDGQLEVMGDFKYLLSPQDLAAVELVPQMIEAGVVSFKIEGRLKGPEYVALTTRVYREAVDKAWAALSSSQDPTSIAGAPQLSDAEWRDLQQVFARGQDGAHTGLTPGFLQGPNHQSLVRGRAPRHRGVFLGKLLDVSPNGNALRVELAAPVRRGDGIVIDQGRPEDDEIGGSVFTIKSPKERQQGQRGRQASSARGRPGSSQGGPVHQAEAGSVVELVLGPAHVDLRSVRPGHLLWKNKDPALEAKIRATYEALSAAQRRRVPVTVQIEAEVGKPLRITLRDSEGRVSSAATEVAGVEATGRPIAPADLEKAVGKHLGDEGSLEASRWDFSGCDFGGETGKGVFYPVTAIKEARRKAVADLLEQQAAGPAVQLPPALSPSVALDNLLEDIRAEGRLWQASQGPGGLAEPTLRVLCRTKAQVDAAAAVPWLSEMILDFLEVHGLKEACATVREAGKRVVVAAPRIIKPDERRLWVFFLKLDADALLVRGAGLLHQLMQLGGPGTQVPDAGGHAVPALEGDFSLNATNVVSADVLLRHGLARLAPTYDCNAQQLVDMARGLGPRSSCLEVVLHTNLPIFHTEHCVFARFLSSGNSYLDCGHPCEHKTVHLRDASGNDHLVLADSGCRNTVFSSSAQSGLPYLENLVGAGYGCFRVELVDQPAEVVAPLLEGYRAALQDAVAQVHGGSTGQRDRKKVAQQRQALWQWMQELPDANGKAHGVGVGSLEVRGERSTQSLKPTAAALKAAGRA